MARSIARLANDLASAKAAGDTAEVARIRAEVHNRPSTRAALRALDGRDSATLSDVKRGRRARA